MSREKSAPADARVHAASRGVSTIQGKRIRRKARGESSATFEFRPGRLSRACTLIIGERNEDETVSLIKAPGGR